MVDIEIDDLEFFDDLDSTEVDDQVNDDAADDTAAKAEETPDDVTDDDFETPADDDKEDKDDKADKAADNSGDDVEIYKSAFDLYKERGLLTLPDDYEFEATEEGFQKALDKSAEAFKEAVLEDLRSDLPAEGLALVKYMKDGGKDISKFIEVYSKPNYETLELTDDSQRKEVLQEYYKRTTKWSPEKINKHITTLEVTGDLEDEAESAKSELVTFSQEEKERLNQEAIAAAEARKTAEAEAFKSLSKTIEENKDINGYPITKNDVNTVIPFLLKPIKLKDGRITTAYNQKHNEIMQDPKKAVLLAKLMQSDLDLSVLGKTQETKVTKTVKSKLQNALNFKGKVEKEAEDDDWDEIL